MATALRSAPTRSETPQIPASSSSTAQAVRCWVGAKNSCHRLADAGRFVIRYDNRDTGKTTPQCPPGKAKLQARRPRQRCSISARRLPDRPGAHCRHLHGRHDHPTRRTQPPQPSPHRSPQSCPPRRPASSRTPSLAKKSPSSLHLIPGCSSSSPTETRSTGPTATPSSRCRSSHSPRSKAPAIPRTLR